MVCRFSRTREKEIWQRYSFFVLTGCVFCFLFLVTSPRFCFVWCGCSSIEGFCRVGFGFSFLVFEEWNRCFAAACFASRTAQRKVVVLMGIWMFFRCFLLDLFGFYWIFKSNQQLVFRKAYAVWRVLNLWILYGEKRFFVGFVRVWMVVFERTRVFFSDFVGVLFLV